MAKFGVLRGTDRHRLSQGISYFILASTILCAAPIGSAWFFSVTYLNLENVLHRLAQIAHLAYTYLVLVTNIPLFLATSLKVNLAQ